MKQVCLMILVSFTCLKCTKDPTPPEPENLLATVSTSAITSITSTTAVSGGNVSAGGSSTVTARGVCWSISPNPLVTNNHTTDAGGTGSFTSSLTGLTPNATYYVRAYATNSEGTAYGNEVSFIASVAAPTNLDSAKMFFTIGPANGVSSLVAYNADKQVSWAQMGTWSLPEYSENKLFTANFGSIMSLNLDGISSNWVYSHTGTSLVLPNVVNDTVVTGGSGIAPHLHNSVLLLNKETGALIWSKYFLDQPLVQPVLNAGKVFVLTVNGTGTVTTLTAYDVATRNLVWQKVMSTGFLMSVPPEMIIRNDTLIVGAPSSLITVLNKNTGNVYWSKSLNTKYSHVHNDKIVYNDEGWGNGRVTALSLATGNIVTQAPMIHYSQGSGRLSYIYKNDFYYKTSDSIYCTDINSGILKWRKNIRSSYFGKFIVIDNLLYANNIHYNSNAESKIMIMKAEDFSVKDSILVPKQGADFSILSATGKYYN